MFNKDKINKKRPWKAMSRAGVMVVLVFVLTACGSSGDVEGNAGQQGGKGSVQAQEENTSDVSVKALAEGEALVIDLAEVTDQASFYPVDIGGTKMEVLAVKAPDGTVRTAFNTCQVCYDSGRGYYKQSGDKLVCQNCGNQFTMSLVQVESGGCNPWPIFDENKTISPENITISYDFLKESQGIFENWKQSY